MVAVSLDCMSSEELLMPVGVAMTPVALMEAFPVSYSS
jgi:hypothetical protein